MDKVLKGGEVRCERLNGESEVHGPGTVDDVRDRRSKLF